MEGLISDCEWDRDSVINLIELFRNQPALWDSGCADFKIRNKKHDAWESIARDMKMSRGETEKKMRCLIGQFQRSLKKKSGAGADEQVKWFAFNSLLFLKDKTQPRTYRSAGGLEGGLADPDDNQDETATDEEETPTLELSTSGTDASAHERNTNAGPARKNGTQPAKQNTAKQGTKRTIPPPPRPIKKITTREMAVEAYGVMKKLSKEEDQQTDEFDVFGNHVAFQIRNLKSNISQVIAKQRVTQVLYYLEMEQIQSTYTSSSSSRNVSTPASPCPNPYLDLTNISENYSQSLLNQEQYDATHTLISSVLKDTARN